MIRIFLVFLLLLASVYLGLQLKHDPGYVLIAINHWTIETSFWIAIASLLIVFILLHTLMVVFHKILLLPTQYSQWKARRRARKAEKTTRQGLIEYSEGYWQDAKNHLIKALPNTDTPLLNYLTAAKAAQKMGDSHLRDEYLQRAELTNPAANLAVKLTQAEFQLADQQWREALITLQHLQTAAPHHPYVLKLLVALYRETQDWPQLIALLPQIKKQKLLNKDRFNALQHESYLAYLSDLVRISDEKVLSDLYHSLPKYLRLDSELVFCYASFLMEKDQKVLAESMLRQSLEKKYDENLIQLYGQFYINEKQQKFAETLIKTEADSHALYLCLGRLAMANQLWGRAKNYFEKSLALRSKPETYQALGKLYEQLGERDKALVTYRDGVESFGN